MTRAEIKAILQRYDGMNREMRQIKERIRMLETSIGPSYPGTDGMPHGAGISDPTYRKASALVELTEAYRDMEARLLEDCIEIEELIESLEPTERRLARCRYIEGRTWEEVCVEMGYSWRQVHRIHARILDKLASTYESQA